MCLYGTNLNFIRNIVPRCSWQACGGVCLAFWFVRECLYDPHICTPLYICISPYTSVCSLYYCTSHTSVHPPIYLYAPCMFVHPHTSPTCPYNPIHLYTPIHLYIPHTSVCSSSNWQCSQFLPRLWHVHWPVTTANLLKFKGHPRAYTYIGNWYLI